MSVSIAQNIFDLAHPVETVCRCHPNVGELVFVKSCTNETLTCGNATCDAQSEQVGLVVGFNFCRVTLRKQQQYVLRLVSECLPISSDAVLCGDRDTEIESSSRFCAIRLVSTDMICHSFFCCCTDI